MSWQELLDNNLINSGDVSQAAIFDLDGTELATSPSFKVSSTEVKDIIAGFDNPNVLDDSGVFVAGNKYRVLKIDNRLIINMSSTGSGVCIAKTKQLILIGVYKEDMNGDQCKKIVEAIGEHLFGNGY